MAQVSCFGDDLHSDTGDNWKAEMDKASEWVKDKKVRFQHMDTGSFLGSHDKKFNRPIAGQTEVRLLLVTCHTAC